MKLHTTVAALYERWFFVEFKKRPAVMDRRYSGEIGSRRYAMKTVTRISAVFTGLVLILNASVQAHHSRPVFYDMGKTIRITGVVKDVRIVNPHSTFLFEVTEPNGEKTQWVGTTASGAALFRAGWTKETIKAGTVVIFEGNPARDETARGMLIDTFTMPDGKKLSVKND